MKSSQVNLMKKIKRSTIATIKSSSDSLRDFLNQLLAPVKDINDPETIEWCKWLMAGGQTPEEFANEVKQYDNATTCGLVWTANFVAYRCRTCGISPCMSLCAECFQRGNHEGHDFNMFRSQAGGACDCGDTYVMKESGFCWRHGPQAQEEKPNAPDDLMCLPNAIMPRLIFRLIQHMRENCNSPATVTTDADAFLNMFHDFSDMGTAMRRVMTQALTDPQVYAELTEWSHPSADPELSDTMLSTTHIYHQALKSLMNPEPPEELKDCPSLQEQLVHKTFLEELMFWTVKFEFPQKVVCLLLNMLPDPDYKEPLTRAFVLHYSRIPMMLERSRSPDTLSNRVVHVSVQLFSNESLALKMTTELNLLHVMVVSLKYMMTKILIPNTLHDPEKNFHEVVDCGQQVMKEHCYWPLVSDLNNVLSHRPVAFKFMSDDNLLEMWFAFLSMFQGMNVNQRELCQHIEFEPTTYYAAFSAELEASAYPMWSLVSHLKDESTLHLTKNVLNACITALQDWFDAINFTQPVMADYTQISFHLPLHRYLAVLISQAVKCQGVTLKEILPPPDILNLAYQHPLMLQVAFYEILNGMWVRNGVQIRGQMMTYIQCNFCNSMVDADLYLLQICATQIEPEKFLTSVIDMFRVKDALSITPYKNPTTACFEYEFEPAMLESCLTFLATLIDMRANLGVSESWVSKLEIVTLLCMGDKTHSQLIELMPERSGTGHIRDFDVMLSEVADYRAPSNMQQGMYAPKPQVWEELYDPIHVLLRAVQKRDFQTSMDRFTEYVQQTKKLKPGSGNVWPPFKPPAPCGDPYEDPSKLLQSRIFHAVIFCVLYKAVDRRNVSEHVLALAVYLLEIAILSSPPCCESELCQTECCDRYDVKDTDLTSFYEQDWLSHNLRTIIHSLVFFHEPEKSSDCIEMESELDSNDNSHENGEGIVVPGSHLRALVLAPENNETAVGRPYPMQQIDLPSTSQESNTQLVPVNPSTSSGSSRRDTSTEMVPINRLRCVKYTKYNNLRRARALGMDVNVPQNSNAITGQLATSQSGNTQSGSSSWQLLYRPLEVATVSTADVVPSTPKSVLHKSLCKSKVLMIRRQKTLMSKDDGKFRLDDLLATQVSMPVNESIISLLLKLHAQLSGTPDSYVPGQQTSEGLLDSRIGDGPFFIAKVLDRIASLDERCRDYIKETKEKLWPKRAEEDGMETKAREAKEREERRRRAKERQQKLIEEFASKQKQFMEKAMETEENCECMDWNEENAAQIKSEYDCVICNQTTPSTQEKPMGLVVLVQASSVLGHKRKSNTDEILPTSDEEKKVLLREDSLASDFDKRVEELNREFDTNSWLLSINLGWDGGVHVQTCGHHLHMDCLKSYMQSLSQQRQQALAVDRGEYACPLCRRLANSVLPLVPELGEVSSMARSRPLNLANQILSISMLLRNCVSNMGSSNLTEAMDKSMEDMMNCAHMRFKNKIDTNSPQGVFLFVSSIARTNLEIEIVQKGGSFLTKSNESALIPKRSCIVPLLHVLAFHGRLLPPWRIWQTWEQLSELPTEEVGTQVAYIQKDVPLLLKDPVALLIQFLLFLPLNLDQSYFSCIVKCLYNLLYFQVLSQISINMTESERESWRDPTLESSSDIKSVDAGLRFVINQLASTTLYVDSGNSSTSEGNSYSNKQAIEAKVQSLCLPYLRIAALLRHHLFNEELPEISEETEFVRLVYYLELVSEGMNWSKFNAAVAISFPEPGLLIPRMWFRKMSTYVERSQRAARNFLSKLHLLWYPPRLLTLPQSYDRIFQYYHKRQCNHCHSVPREASVCLLCGTLVCFKETCCKNGSIFETVQHSSDCGAGTGMFLVVTSSYVIVIRGKRACVWGSVYLDSFGEEDRELKRGKPLYLCPERYQLLQEQWITHRFEHTNKNLEKDADQSSVPILALVSILTDCDVRVVSGLQVANGVSRRRNSGSKFAMTDNHWSSGGGAGVKMESIQPALDPRKHELLEARFIGARMSAGAQVQPMAPQQTIVIPSQTSQNQDSNMSTGSSHSDKEIEPSATPEKLSRPTERKRKRKVSAPDDSGGVQGKSSRGGSSQDSKKINDYFAKQQGTSPVRHGGAKSPSAQPSYPMYPPSSPQPTAVANQVPPELGTLMQPPRPPIGSTKAPPRPAQASPRTPTEVGPPRPLNEFENASDLELRNKLNEIIRSNEELRHQLATSQKTIEQHKSHIDKCIEVVKKLLKEKSNIEKKEARQKCMQNRLRLGQFVTQRVGATFQENWTDGYAFQELARRQEEITTEREEIDRQKKLLLKKRPSNDSGRKRNSNPPGSASMHNGTDAATFLKPDSLSSFTWQEYYEADEILKLRQSALKKEDADLQLEMEKLERERNLHIRELKRIHNEDQSRFNSHPVLNERYLLLMLLGKGGFSEVHKAFDLKEQRYVACKVHQLNKDWKEDKKANYIKHALREYNIHKALDHPRVVKLYDVFEIDANSFCTVLEYCDGHDLDFYLKQHKTIPEREARSIVMQVVSALKYLNEIKPPVIHYDLKPGNILLTEGNVCGEIKITDFGLSKVMDEENYNPDHGMDLTSQGAGTYWYLPPECFVVGKNPPKISSKVDVWSVGVIFYQCLYGKKPFGHNQSQATILEENTILKATDVQFANKPTVSNEAKSFIRSCLAYRKEERIDVFALARHEYLQPPVPKHGRNQSSQAQQAQQQQVQAQVQHSTFSTGMFSGMNASSSS